MSSLRDIIACAVNSIEAGVENKEDSINSIQLYVEEHYIDKKAIEKLPTEAFYKLNTDYGVEVDVKAGRLSNINLK